MKRLVLILNLIWVLSGLAYSQALKVESGQVNFRVKQLGFNVKGVIGGFSGKVNFDPMKPQKGFMEGKIKVATLETGINARDNHLKSDDYFDVANFPEIVMTSKKISRKEGGYKGTFDLTIKNITKEIEIDFTFVDKILKSSFEIDRGDFDLGKNGIIMGKTAYVTIEVKTSH